MSKNFKNKLKGISLEKQNPIKGQSDSGTDYDQKVFTLCFKHLNNDNGEHHSEWESEQLLSQAIDKFKHYCNKSMAHIWDTKFKPYNQWPSSSKFKKPAHLPNCDKLNWASMHIGNKPCVIGYMVENIFYVTWFDKHHHFWFCGK